MRRLLLPIAAVSLLAAPAGARAADVATLAVSGGALTVTALPGKANVTVVVNTNTVPGSYFVGDRNGTVHHASGLCSQTTQSGIDGWLCLGVSSITENLGDGDDTGLVSDRAGSGVPSAINGGPGDDTLVGGPETDAFTGGTGTDTVAYVAPTGTGITRTAPVTAVLPEPGAAPTTGNGAAGENDSIAGDVEGLVGGNGDDTLTGNSAANTIAGAAPPGTPGVVTSPAGDDTISGGAGDDQLVAGDDGTVHGDAGNDTIVGGRHATTLYGDDGSDRLVSGPGNDTVHGGAGADYLVYAAVAQVGITRNAGVTARLADATPTTRNGDRAAGEDDTVYGDVENLVGGNGSDHLTGNAGPNTILGVAPAGTPGVTPGPPGNDVLDGAGGDDILLGDSGNDFLVGGPGHDTLSAGAGNDVLATRDGVAEAPACGAGNDYVSADGSDTPAPDCERVVTNGSPAPAPDTARPKLREHPRTVRLRRHRRARLWLRCGNEPHGCHGTLVLRTRHHGHRLLARRTFRIGHATSKRFTLHLRRRVLKLLPHHHRLRTTLRVTARDRAGNRAHRTFHVTLTRR